MIWSPWVTLSPTPSLASPSSTWGMMQGARQAGTGMLHCNNHTCHAQANRVSRDIVVKLIEFSNFDIDIDINSICLKKALICAFYIYKQFTSTLTLKNF